MNMGKTLDKIVNVGRKAVVGGMIAAAGWGLLGDVKGSKGTLIPPAPYTSEQDFLDDNPHIVKLQNFNYFLLLGDGKQYTCNSLDFLLHNSVTGQNEIPQDKYHFAWFTQEGDNLYFDGAAENGHYGYNEFIEGFYSADLPLGYQPKDLNIVKDGDADGPGYYDSDTGEIFAGTDDVYYTKNDILFGDLMIRGDVSQISAKSTEQWLYQPKMVLSPIPEPATITLLGLGGGFLVRTRSRKRGL